MFVTVESLLLLSWVLVSPFHLQLTLPFGLALVHVHLRCVLVCVAVYDSWFCSRWLVDRIYLYVAQAVQPLDSIPVAVDLLGISLVRP